MKKKILDKRYCPECGREMEALTKITWEDEKLGSFSLRCKKGEYYICSCGTTLVRYKLALRCEKEENKRKQSLEEKE